MTAIKLFFIMCSFTFLAACSSTPEPQVESTTLDVQSVVETEKVAKIVPPEVVEYSGIEVLSSCLQYVVIRNDEFIGYQPRYFDFDTVVSTQKADKQMNCVAGFLNDYPQQAVEVRGYTDNKGSEAYNLLLSQKRSASVVDELLMLGVANNQLANIALGKSEPINNNLTEEERSLNRRVEFVLVNDE
jgi:outer membrane protein OmpA-like peptidoglycan-associated protein